MIYYVSGGQKSGKSRFAMNLALKFSNNPVYLATARVWDESFSKRIEKHQKDRGEAWINVEKEKNIDELDLKKQVVVFDCITLWLTNIFHDNNYKTDETLEIAFAELERFINKDFTLIGISNELGMGLHADSVSGRNFVDIHGQINQFLALKADKSIFMISGLPLEVK